jgi:hypothetical protein
VWSAPVTDHKLPVGCKQPQRVDCSSMLLFSVSCPGFRIWHAMVAPFTCSKMVVCVAALVYRIRDHVFSKCALLVGPAPQRPF